MSASQLAFRPFPTQHKVLGFLFLVILIAILGIYLRVPIDSNHLINIDETIPVAVHEAMEERGILDPNWSYTALPEYFRYDQYNFYSYNLISHFFLSQFDNNPEGDIFVLRVMNYIFQIGAALFLFDAARRLGVKSTVALVGSAAFAVSPTFVHDSHMARPESLLYLCSSVFIWIYSLKLNSLASGILLGLVSGFGTTVKLTFPIVMVSFLILDVYYFRSEKVFEYLKKYCLLFIFSSFSFVIFAPYQLINFNDFLNGINYLSNQYSAGHPPHSSLSFNPINQALWIARFFGETYGFVMLTVVIALIFTKGRRIIILSMSAPFIILFLYFSTKSVFFERNFAHVMPFVIFSFTLAFGSLVDWVRIKTNSYDVISFFWACIVICPMILVSALIYQSIHTEEDKRGDFIDSHPGYAILNPSQSLMLMPPPRCGNVLVIEYDTERARVYREIMAREGFMTTIHYQGPFEGMAASTLQTYLGYSLRGFHKGC